MLETLFLAALIYLFLTRTKKKRKPRTLDAELKELIQDSNDATAISLEIKRYLLDVIRDDKESAAKFAPARINQAQHILDRAGPAAQRSRVVREASTNPGRNFLEARKALFLRALRGSFRLRKSVFK